MRLVPPFHFIAVAAFVGCAANERHEPTSSPAVPEATVEPVVNAIERRMAATARSRNAEPTAITVGTPSCHGLPRRPDGLIARASASCIAIAHGHVEPSITGPRVPDVGEVEEVPSIGGLSVYEVRSIPPAATRETVDFIDAETGAFFVGYVGPSLASIQIAEKMEAASRRSEASE